LVFRTLGLPFWVRFDLGLHVHPREAVLPIEPTASWPELFRDLAILAGGKDAGTNTALAVSTTAREQARTALRITGVPEGAAFLVCHPGVSTLILDRSWKIENYAATIDSLFNDFGLPTIITGLPSETPLARTLIAACRNKYVYDLTGKLSFDALTGVLERASLVLINDTGPMHVANSLGTPVVAILGATSANVLGVNPQTTSLVRAGLPCQPCAAHGGSRGCSNPVRFECLSAVTVPAVLAAARARLKHLSNNND
jgi:ADP-heptose:LPS heptosyltransferase